MARKLVTPPVEPAVVFKSSDEIERAIGKIGRRLDEVERLDIEASFQAKDGKIDIVESNIRNTIRDVFGEGSTEFQENKYLEIWSGSLIIGMPDYQRLSRHLEGRAVVTNKLNALIDRLKEKRQDLEGGEKPSPSLYFNKLNLHPRILDLTEERFMDGHHWDAVFAASKALVNFVKERSGLELDGAKLMTTAFSKNSPVLQFNSLADQTDIDEQEGMMHLFLGAVLAIRNPGGHSFPEGSEQRALEYISFLSTLAYLVQDAKRKKSP